MDGIIPCWVRVMADYSSDGLWDSDGCMMERKDFPISEELKIRHKSWCDAFESSYPDDTAFDMIEFSKRGLEIARDIKAELPDWTVIYFDESRLNLSVNLDQPREEFEYEIEGHKDAERL